MKINLVLMLVIFPLGSIFSGCAYSPAINDAVKRTVTGPTRTLNIYDKEGYYQGYVKSLPSGRCQIFDKEGYYIGEAREN